MLFIFLFVLYQLFQIAFLPFFIPYTFVKATDTNSAQEQMGIVPATQKSQHVIWIHGLNAGEILSVQALIEKVKREIPGSVCYITASTQEGRRVAQQTLKADFASLLPQDNIASMALAFERINPSSIIVLEHDVWPTMVTYARIKNVPIYLLNAQMTSSTAKNLEQFNSVYKDLFNTFTTIFTQSDFDKTLFKEAGILEKNLSNLGNIKAFNVMPKKEALLKEHKAALDQFNKERSSTILLVGSVHRGEVDHYLKLFTKLKKQDPSLKLILAPRFSDWHDELVQKVTTTKLPFFIWNDNSLKVTHLGDLVTELGKKVLSDNDIVVINTFGKLFMLSAITDIYYPGGTFVPVGGHNVLESAAWGNAMIIGPNDENTREIVNQLVTVNGIIKVTTPYELEEQTKRLLTNRVELKQLGNQALTWISDQAEYVEAGLEKVVMLLQEAVTHNFATT